MNRLNEFDQLQVGMETPEVEKAGSSSSTVIAAKVVKYYRLIDQYKKKIVLRVDFEVL